MKRYDVSVLVLEDNQGRQREIEELLERIGFSNEDKRHLTGHLQEFKSKCLKNNYELIIGDIPEEIRLPKDQKMITPQKMILMKII